MPQPASANPALQEPPISAIEEQLRQLGHVFNPGGMATVQPGPPMQGTPDPQSAIAAIIAAREAAAAQAAARAAPPPPPPAPTKQPPKVDASKVTQKPDEGWSPWWMLPAGIVGAILGRKTGGRGAVARGVRGAGKAAEEAPTSVAAGTTTTARKATHPSQDKLRQHPLRKRTPEKREPRERTTYGPQQPYGPQRPPMQGPPAPPPPVYGPQQPQAALAGEMPPTAGITLNPDGTLPPPTLTRTDVTSEIPLALAERARGNIRVPGEGQLPPPPPMTPRPVLPAYTAPLDEAADLSGNELAKAIRVSGEVARTRARSAAKTERINRRRPGPVDRPPQQFTPDRRVPKEEGERKSFNEVTKAIREAKNPPKAEPKDLKPWLKEPKKDIGQPVLPRKKPGPAPKLKRKPVPEVAEALGKRKVETARKGKTTPQMRSETGRKRPAETMHSGNEFGKFTGRSGARTAVQEPAVLRNLSTAEKAAALATAKRLLQERAGSLPLEKASRTNRAVRHRTKGKYAMNDDFKAVYGDGPEARALNDAAVAQVRLRELTSQTARKIKGK